jgi:hypothetical protein
MQRDDMVCIRHILDAARKAILFTRNHTRKELDTNEMLSLSAPTCKGSREDNSAGGSNLKFTIDCPLINLQ